MNMYRFPFHHTYEIVAAISINQTVHQSALARESELLAQLSGVAMAAKRRRSPDKLFGLIQLALTCPFAHGLFFRISVPGRSFSCCMLNVSGSSYLFAICASDYINTDCKGCRSNNDNKARTNNSDTKIGNDYVCSYLAFC